MAGAMYLLQISRSESDFLSITNYLSNRPGRSIPALLIVLDGRKCTLFDGGTVEHQALVAKAIDNVSRDISARVFRVVLVLLSWIVL